MYRSLTQGNCFYRIHAIEDDDFRYEAGLNVLLSNKAWNDNFGGNLFILARLFHIFVDLNVDLLW